ncbi:MAG: hypothetical protein ACLRO0_05640 [Massilimicrobiota timonensis]
MELCQSPENVSLLFAQWRATLIYSYLQGCMGECYVNEMIIPSLSNCSC